MTKLTRIIVVLFVTAGIAFLGLLAGGRSDQAKARRGEDPIAGHYPEAMPRYPGATEFPLGTELTAAGRGVKMSYLYTEDDPLKIASFYASHWKAAGYHVTEDITPQGGVVAAYDPAKGHLRQVLIKHENGRSAVFPSLQMDPVRPVSEASAEGDDVPVYPGSEGVLQFGARDPGHRSRVTMFTNHGGMVNNVGFYRSRMPELGWTERTPKTPALIPEQLSQTMIFHKGARELTVNISVVDASNRVRVHLAEATGAETGLPDAPAEPGGDRP